MNDDGQCGRDHGRDEGREDEVHWIHIRIKHCYIWRQTRDDKVVQPPTKAEAYDDAKTRQNDRFTVDVHSRFIIVEARHFNRGELTDSFSYVNVSQVVDNHNG